MTEKQQVESLYLKPQKGMPMEPVSKLELQCGVGIIGNDCAPSYTPRQVTIGFADDLGRWGVSHAGSRCNVILTGAPGAALGSGALVALGGTTLRITVPCEPCAHGARLAGTPVPKFRNIERYLALVVQSGEVSRGLGLAVQAGVYPAAPSDFRRRCSWALDQIPMGRAVRTLDFLAAMAMSSAYARTLPRWMRAAKEMGKPVHRVLTQSLAAPNWCPNALELLAAEEACSLDHARYDLTGAIWS